MRTRLVVLALAAACGGKSGPSLDELHKKNAPVIEPKLAHLETIAKAPLPDPTGAVKLSGPMIEWTGIADGTDLTSAYGNATLAFDVDLADLTSSGRSDLRTSNIDVINDCYTAVRQKQMAGRYYSGTKSPPQENELVVKEALAKCALLKYLVVARIDQFKDTQYIDKEKFGAGGAKASLLVFDLDTGGYLGGVPVVAVSSDRAYDPSSDLAVNFYKAVDAALNAAIPGATLPYRSSKPAAK